MGIKDVFDRMKGKPKSKRDDARDAAAARRDTSEETIQVGIGNLNAAPSSSREQQDPTMIAPRAERPMPRAPVQAPPTAIPNVQANRDEATIVAPASSAPVPQPPPPSVAPQAPPPAAPAPEPTAVAPPAPTPEPTAVQPPAPPPAESPSAPPSSTIPVAPPSAAVGSADQTQYVVPEKAEVNDLAGVLVGIFGEAKNQVFLVRDGQCTLGRSETCEIQIMDAKISREHASISCGEGSVVIQAVNDRNPVLVNDQAITESVTIGDGDKLQFGNTGSSIFRFRTIDGL